MEYPKINSLFKRQFTYEDPETGAIKYLDKGKSGNPLIIGEYACEEFAAINRWTVTEKVDGTNVRIIFDRKNEGRVSFHGRTDNAQFPTFLLSALQQVFTWEKMSDVFKESNYVILFGEGYGPKIQSGGYYRKDASFVLFDVYCSGWWLKRDGVEEVAKNLGIDCVPLLQKKSHHGYCESLWTTDEIVDYVSMYPVSVLAQVEKREMEGIVARSEPPMMFRKGGPIMFKLKCRDFK